MTDNTWTNERRIAMSRDSSRIVLNFFHILLKESVNICGQLFHQYRSRSRSRERERVCRVCRSSLDGIFFLSCSYFVNFFLVYCLYQSVSYLCHIYVFYNYKLKLGNTIYLSEVVPLMAPFNVDVLQNHKLICPT